MRQGLAIAALLVPLAGCAYQPGPQPAGWGYAPPAPGYVPPAPGYAPDYGYDPGGELYPGYYYNNGAPSLVIEGNPLPLLFFDGGWGYYDGERRWHRAPERVWRDLDQRHPRGAGVRPFSAPPLFRQPGFGGGGFQQPVRPGFARPPEPVFNRPPEPRPFPGGPGGFGQPRPDLNRQLGTVPGGMPGGVPGGFGQGRPEFRAPPPAGPMGMPRPVGPPPAVLARPAPAPAAVPQQHPGGGGGGHNCPQGQRIC